MHSATVVHDTAVVHGAVVVHVADVILQLMRAIALQVDTCLIDSICYVDDDKNTTDKRLACKPSLNQKEWTVVGSMCILPYESRYACMHACTHACTSTHT